MTLRELCEVVTPNTRLHCFFLRYPVLTCKAGSLEKADERFQRREVTGVIPYAAYEVEVHLG